MYLTLGTKDRLSIMHEPPNSLVVTLFGLAEMLLDVVLELPRLNVPGDFKIHAEC